MPYKLIAIDIDGTLLTTARTLTPRTTQAIVDTISNGIHVVLCTGRSLHSARPVAAQVHPRTHLVFHSGALILEHLDGPVLRTKNLARARAGALIAFLKREGYDPLVYDSVPESQGFLYEAERAPNEWRHRYIQANAGKAKMVPDLHAATVFEPAQLAAAGRRADIDRLQKSLQAGWPDVGVIRSRSTLIPDYWFLEIVPVEVSKGAALAFLGAHYAIPPSDMIAVGDNFNDLDMIEYAGLGVAVANAPDEVKAAADVVVPSNDEDGVVYVIERYLLH